jgi:isocitrate lyase
MQGNGAVNIRRDYSQADVDRLAGSFPISHTLAERGAARFKHLRASEPYVPALGALTGNQAIQQVKRGLKAIYLAGSQVAADANAAGQMYPDQSLYPADSVPDVVRRINNALRRADQIAHLEGRDDRTYWMAPTIADAGAGLCGGANFMSCMEEAPG